MFALSTKNAMRTGLGRAPPLNSKSAWIVSETWYARYRIHFSSGQGADRGGVLFGDTFRLRRVQPGNVSEDKIERVRKTWLFDVSSVFGTTDMFSHSYFTSNPDVSPDLIALIRYGARPVMHCGHSSRLIGRFDGSAHQRILRGNRP